MMTTGRVEELLKMAEDRTVAGRTALAGAVSELYFDSSQAFAEREVALMGDILRQLIRDVEMTVRKALAERLAERADAPHDLVVTLANDEIEVAHPILVKSTVLNDNELIEIIRQRSAEHQVAIAMRSSVSVPVSDALVEEGHEGVIKTLLENSGAEMSARTMAYLVEQSQRIDAFQQPLLMRQDLSPELAKRMYWWVSAALREHILENFRIDADDLDGALQKTVKEVIAETRKKSENSTRRRLELAEHLARTNRLTPKFLIQVLREGEIPLFEAMFGKYTGLSLSLVKRVLYEPGGKGLAIACKAIGIEKPDFASIFLLSRGARPGDKRVDPKELTRVLAFYDALNQEGAEAALKRWRLDPDYLAAIRDLKDKLLRPM